MKTKKRIILLLSAWSICCISAWSAVYYVNASVARDTIGSAGDPTSWGTACNDLQLVVNYAEPGDTVFVSKGTYAGGFIMKDGVQVYGGFAGTEATTAERLLKVDDTNESNCTVLDGKNHNRVLTQPGDFIAQTVWDGFVLKNGHSFKGAGASLKTNGILRRSIIKDCKTENPSIFALNFVPIPGGTFTMGCTGDGTNQCATKEFPTHEVTVHDFLISDKEVTVVQYVRFLNDAGVGADCMYEVPGYGQRKLVNNNSGASGIKYENGKWVMTTSTSTASPFWTHPIFDINWYGAYAFCQYYGYRLPTEAEWEYAARGGISNKAYSGEPDSYSDSTAVVRAKVVGWSASNAGGAIQVGRTKVPNAYGLYDMSGNVREWVNDYYTQSYSPQDMANPNKNNSVLRGGHYTSSYYNTRVSYRDNSSRDSYIAGFRICM